MDVDTVREAIIKLRAFAKSLDCDYQEECTPGEDDMCQRCKHVYIADQVLAAFSSIDPDAIRAEARAEALYEAAERASAFLDEGYRDYHDRFRLSLRAAIANAEKHGLDAGDKSL